MTLRKYFTYTLTLLLFSCSSSNDTLFVPLNRLQTGITFSNTLDNSIELNILNYLYYYNGAGIISADFNNDGLLDLFFTGNEVEDELYLNKGGLRFENINLQAGIISDTNWSTGATHVDINNDGLLDIYICKASGHLNLKGKNFLYVNQGINTEGIPTFKEEASKYGLDFTGLSTHATFFDYDLDGDLDMYLLNHSVHPNRNYGSGSLREGYHPQYGDILFRNTDGYFEDVSEEAGIFQGRTGYGLGLSIGDVNSDGYPDIYIGNDFFENDYFYINQTNGTFKETISENTQLLGHTSHFSMGNGISDLNNDGLQDIVSLDMLPEDLKTYKTSGLEYAYPIYRQYLNKGYAPQFMQNTLHYNLDGQRFAEMANIAGISATEWSWGVLPADFDNDGQKDLFISNGIVGATNDMDYMNFIANEDIQKRIDAGLDKEDLPLIAEIPQKKVANYFFRNQGQMTFENVSSVWSNTEPSYSNGSVYGDFDNDGDLDLVINNINEPVTFLENTSANTNQLTFRFLGTEANRFGIGTKVTLFSSQLQVQENFPTKGYLSAVAPELYFGLGKDSIIDSLKVKWPNGRTQVLKNIQSNQTITLNYRQATIPKNADVFPKHHFDYFDSIIPFSHNENISLDFDREPLIPFANSNEGPSISVGDVNNDNLHDVFIGGGKKQGSQLFVQQSDGQFTTKQPELFEENSIREVTCNSFFDANGDGWQDVMVGYGGNEFTSGRNIQPQLYINQKGKLVAQENTFEAPIQGNFSVIEVADLDNDGDVDVVLGSDQIPGQFGKTPKSYILFNNGSGRFIDVTNQFAPELATLGNIKDVKILDINADGAKDLIAVGHWTSPTVFINDGTKLKMQNANGLEKYHGWWNSVELADFDNDGDLDMICGNWGLNSKFQASEEKPITLYRNDFDGNGTIEPLVTYYHKDTETPFASKDELVKQMPFLNKEFLSYAKFASASLSDLFGKDNLAKSEQKKVFELETSYFENIDNQRFEKKELPKLAQISQVSEITCDDLNNDGFLDIILMGNNYHVSTQLGRLDALHGMVLYNDGMGNFKNIEHLKVDGQVNAMQYLTIKNKKGYLIGRNDDSPVFLTKKDTL